MSAVQLNAVEPGFASDRRGIGKTINELEDFVFG